MSLPPNTCDDGYLIECCADSTGKRTCEPTIWGWIFNLGGLVPAAANVTTGATQAADVALDVASEGPGRIGAAWREGPDVANQYVEAVKQGFEGTFEQFRQALLDAAAAARPQVTIPDPQIPWIPLALIGSAVWFASKKL
jgi:hypothetical protein